MLFITLLIALRLAQIYLINSEEPEKVPAGVKMVLPRGGIPSIFQPDFVTAEEAQIPDDAWVLAIYYNGVAKAYSLNLLNRHEIVNDQFGNRYLAAVW